MKETPGIGETIPHAPGPRLFPQRPWALIGRSPGKPSRRACAGGRSAPSGHDCRASHYCGQSRGEPPFAGNPGIRAPGRGKPPELLPDGADFHGGNVNVLPPLLFPEELPGGGMAPDAAEVAVRLLQLRSMSNERGNGPVRTGGAGNAVKRIAAAEKTARKSIKPRMNKRMPGRKNLI